ncbi:MAG TPA: Rrf2 family transcriptional regulator [Chitinophagaceae bacterium]|nr:Rrf2 family transcriptional regulator [Chitinophagaceae bacterium]MCC6635381.1 Rrf2 family transcriptional regulator [Chitinophagaceae bacterium]HMZ46111.1 Rrf2 family transcriptional regulator [Chitinophagaceae bacterium]HNE92496.1 Rrf2 family transcriptional regulator [Chitinophagaceae bacterium]HNF29436.1 Rrf2 family transcriptional regulator [Chitinophagaceae bacterium]
MLSLSCKAAIKAVIFLGSKFETEEKFSIKTIAGFINENEHTVGKLLQKLVKENIINSTKGPNGGFFISAKQINQPVIKIVEAIDGKDIFKQCGLGLEKCSESHPCPFHNNFKPIRDMFKKLCEEKKVIDLYQNVNEGLAYLTN